MSEKTPEEVAVETFHNPYSCAQAVFAAFRKDPSEEDMAFMKANSAGRAEGGICGALFAARMLVGESRRREVDAFFEEHVGGTQCSRIKSEARTPCSQCVLFGARAAAMFMG